MPASLVELEVARGLPVFRCPVTGIPVWTDEGFDETADHSPFIRFFVDWAGEAWAASPSSLEGDDAMTQRELVEVLSLLCQADEDATWDGLMTRLVTSLPSSAVIFEVLNPINPDGCGGGDICYVGFDFAGAWRSDGKRLHLELVGEVN